MLLLAAATNEVIWILHLHALEVEPLQTPLALDHRIPHVWPATYAELPLPRLLL